MGNPGDFVAIEVDDEIISLHDLLSVAKFRGQLGFIEQAVEAALIRGAAARLGIAVSDEELQKEADEFRAGRQLYEAKRTAEWLAANHLSQEDWETQLEDEILRRKARQAVCAGKIEQYFAENKRAWEAATISHLLAADENVARELRAQVVEDQVNFHDLARQFSADEDTRRAGGYLGKCRRKDMEAALTAAVFAAQAGEVAGPVRSERGWRLVLVEALHPARLDDETRSEIAGVLFAEWLAGARRKAKIQVAVLSDM